jgi:hypothetical protein
MRVSMLTLPEVLLPCSAPSQGWDRAAGTHTDKTTAANVRVSICQILSSLSVLVYIKTIQ